MICIRFQSVNPSHFSQAVWEAQSRPFFHEAALRQKRRNQTRPGPAKAIIAVEIEMDVLEKSFIATNISRVIGGKRRCRVKQKKIGAARFPRRLANQIIEPGVGAKRERVAIAGLLKMFRGRAA